ncbi:MAG TPA: DUF2834 domain-containing protein [Anaerolineae bacterium]|nr:DUF2834 domain-containing protein [Anaerolineae bacterium]
MKNLTKTQLLFLGLSLLGIIWPWYYNLQMTDISQFFSVMWDTPVSSSLSADITVAVLTFFVWMIPEGRRVGIRPWVLATLGLLTFLIAFAFTFPFFMFLRARALAGDGSPRWLDH